jgi:hypothetical protein
MRSPVAVIAWLVRQVAAEAVSDVGRPSDCQRSSLAALS